MRLGVNHSGVTTNMAVLYRGFGEDLEFLNDCLGHSD